MVYLVRLKPEGDFSEAYSNRSVLLQSNPAPNSVVICPTWRMSYALQINMIKELEKVNYLK